MLSSHNLLTLRENAFQQLALKMADGKKVEKNSFNLIVAKILFYLQHFNFYNSGLLIWYPFK